MEKQNGSKELKITRIMYILAIVVSLIYILFIGQPDTRTITGWGYDLLDSIRIGELYNFPSYTNELRQMPSNYTMLANMTTAIWLSPLYLMQSIIEKSISLKVYELWYKCLIGIIHFVNVILLKKTLKSINVMQKNIDNVCILYMFSTVVLITVIGQGQIDMFCLFFAILGYYYLINGKYHMMALMFGLGVVYKPFIILIAVPIIVLLSNRLRIRTLSTALCLIIPYLVNALATRIIMPDYGKFVKLVNEQSKEIMGSNRVEEIFALRINSILVFVGTIIVICFVCYYISWHKKVKVKHFMIMPVVSFLSYVVFVSPAAYWFILIVPLLLLMGQWYEKKEEFYLLNISMNLGCMISVYFSEKQYSPNPELSILGFLMGKEREEFFYELFDKQLVVYIQLIFTTVFVISAIIIVGVFINVARKKALFATDNNKTTAIFEKRDLSDNKTNRILFVLQSAPAIIYIIFSFVEYKL